MYSFMLESVKFYLGNIFTLHEASRGAGAQNVSVKLTGCGFDPHLRKWNIFFLYIYFFIFPLWCRGKERR